MRDRKRIEITRPEGIDDSNYKDYLNRRANQLEDEFKANIVGPQLELEGDYLVGIDLLTKHLEHYLQFSHSDHGIGFHGYSINCPIPIPFDLGWFKLSHVESGRTANGEMVIGVHINYEYTSGRLEWPESYETHSSSQGLGIGILFQLKSIDPDQTELRVRHGHSALSRITNKVTSAVPYAWQKGLTDPEEPIHFYLSDIVELVSEEPADGQIESEPPELGETESYPSPFKGTPSPDQEASSNGPSLALHARLVGAPLPALSKKRRREIALKWFEIKERGGVTQASFAEQWGITASTVRKYVTQFRNGVLEEAPE